MDIIKPPTSPPQLNTHYIHRKNIYDELCRSRDKEINRQHLEKLKQFGVTIMNPIGAGHCQVYKVNFEIKDWKDMIMSTDILAMKVVRVYTPGELVTLKQQKDEFKLICNEMKVLNAINHPNCLKTHSIIQFYSQCPDDQYPIRIYVFTEFCNGSLTNFLEQAEGMTEKDVKLIYFQLVSGLNYLHGLDIAHRDLKSENILYKKNYQGNIQFKLGDFGSAHVAKWQRCHDEEFVDEYQRLSECGWGQRTFISDEHNKAVIDKSYGREPTPFNPFLSDYWSIGISLVYICLRDHDAFNYYVYIYRMHRLEGELGNWLVDPANRVLPHNYSPQVKDIIKRTLVKNPTKRLTLKHILQHPWLKDCHDTGFLQFNFSV